MIHINNMNRIQLIISDAKAKINRKYGHGISVQHVVGVRG